MDGQGLRDWNLGGWGAVGIVALLLALLGPYGTFISMPFGLRLVYWGAAAVIIALLVRASMWAILRGLLPATWPILAKRTAAAALAALPGAFLVGRLHGLLTHDVRTAPFALLYAYTIAPTVLATLVLTRRQAVPMTASVPVAAPVPAPDAAATAAGFVARAVPRLGGGRLLALEAEDHYLRVHTDRGSDLVLMRLRDAVADLAGVPGLQVHRSFWVAEAGVAQVTRRGQSWQVVVAGGLTVPVSRNYGASLRAAGWPERYAASVELSGK